VLVTSPELKLALKQLLLAPMRAWPVCADTDRAAAPPLSAMLSRPTAATLQTILVFM
jgi:hypothetical protein